MLGACAAAQAVLLVAFGHVQVQTPTWLHVYGVGEQDSRTVIFGSDAGLRPLIVVEDSGRAVRARPTRRLAPGPEGRAGLAGADDDLRIAPAAACTCTCFASIAFREYPTLVTKTSTTRMSYCESSRHGRCSVTLRARDGPA